MAETFQKEKPPARINLFLEVLKGDAKKKVELPLRLLVLGDFSGKESGVPVGDREKININKDNFNAVMRSANLSLDFTVPDRLKGGDAETKVSLALNDLNSFHPEEVAKQVPQLGRLLATRNLLQDLRNRIISINDFRKELERIVRDKNALEQLAGELEKIVPEEEAQPAPEVESE
jgi:type VI secretion system protein ImpB